MRNVIRWRKIVVDMAIKILRCLLGTTDIDAKNQIDTDCRVFWLLLYIVWYIITIMSKILLSLYSFLGYIFKAK